ncbi:hypothetical protein yinte0001_9560 [Yersinia intermedia ATCC 29909]|nr:hypothetical protein yinte0001_9560 [Yersinia intermedia ATCC 29909]
MVYNQFVFRLPPSCILKSIGFIRYKTERIFGARDFDL